MKYEGESVVLVRIEWKSAVVAFSPWGRGMYSEPAPLMTVRGTRLADTVFQYISVTLNSFNLHCRVSGRIIDALTFGRCVRY